MSTEKIVRTQGREKLKKNGLAKALIGLSVLAVFYLIVESIAYCEGVILELTGNDADFFVSVVCRSVTTLCALLLSPSILGYFKMMYNEADEYEMSDVIYYFLSFKNYTKAVTFIFSYILRIAIPALVCFLPTLVYAFYIQYSNTSAPAFVIVALVIVSSILLLLYSIKYFLSIKLFCDDDSKNLSYYFTTSKVIMRNHRWDVVKLTLSFSLWFLLCITILPMIYVIPYYVQTMCISGKWFYELSRDGQ